MGPRREAESTAAPKDRSRTYLLIGGALLCAAAAVALLQGPRGGSSGSGPSGASSAQPGSAACSRTLDALGPIRTGGIVGDGWRVDRIEGGCDEVLFELSQLVDGASGTSLRIGLAAPGARGDPPIVPMDDVYVWYSGETGGEATEALIRALTDRLRAAAEGQPLHARVMAWARATGAAEGSAHP